MMFGPDFPRTAVISVAVAVAVLILVIILGVRSFRRPIDDDEQY
jgi:hypothetical protein